MAEVLGKLGEFPYWLLLKGGKVDRNVLSNLLYSFLREPLNKKIEQISYLLNLEGEDVEVTPYYGIGYLKKRAIWKVLKKRGWDSPLMILYLKIYISSSE